MSVGHHRPRDGSLPRGSARSAHSARSQSSVSASAGHVARVVTQPIMDPQKVFEPCAATASMFLYAQGTSILCLHHDTLALDRRFERHAEEIAFVAVDNVSEQGAGRQVVSYDVGQTAIVWDLFTGEEIARFASYERISVASWMRNGNVAFGNVQGNVILFEPSTSEHISARTIFDPISSIAPAADCRRYAIGYTNGSVLIAALQPSFTILHTLTTPRAPSPVVSLAWHASSSKQKSDMLATQTQDGDLRVWSVAKAENPELPKVVRVLKRTESNVPGPNWLSWSKNGRVIQFTEGETYSWDVRTKHVTYESIPTLDVVYGLAVHGPTSTLFTLGSDYTVQQFDLTTPSLVANKQHPPPIPPPSPPVSIEEQTKTSEAESAPESSHDGPSTENYTSEDGMPSPLQKISKEMDRMEKQRKDRAGAFSPTSSASQSLAPSMSSRSSAGVYRRHRSKASLSSKGTSNEGTLFSGGSSVPTGYDASVGLTSPSVTSSSRSRPQASRLRQEVLRSPEEAAKAVDLFPFTKGRLSDLSYRPPEKRNEADLTPADLRREMLSVIFGWDHDIVPLIREELRRHTSGSPSAVLLSKWLGDVNADMMPGTVGSEAMTSSDWMLLALSQIGGEASTKKIGQAFVQRLLEKGEIHAAATILVGIGDQHDAIEVYLSHRYHMEAVLLSSLSFPNDWQRLSGLIRRWGEYAVQRNQQQLAIRCFSCTGMDHPGVLTSPRGPDPANIDSIASQASGAPVSPPDARSNRMTAKNSALKLITTFDDKKSSGLKVPQNKLFGLNDEGSTPQSGAGVTPIAESAISPGGGHLFPRSARSYNPDSARTATPGGFSRRRLPSIGETPVEETPHVTAKPKRIPTPAESASDRSKSDSRDDSQSVPMTLSSARFGDRSENNRSPMTQVTREVLPSPAHDAFRHLQDSSNKRNGSRDRKPDGLQIQWPPMESIITGDYMSPSSSASGERPKHSRSYTESSVVSPTSARDAQRKPSPTRTVDSQASSLRSPPVTGRSMDRYISSLEEAQYYSKRKERERSQKRQESRHRHGRRASVDTTSESARMPAARSRAREPSEDRGRNGKRYIKPAKRSPSSPVPMSPDDFPIRSNESYEDERYYGAVSPGASSQKSRGTDGQSVRTGRSRRDASRRRSKDRKPGSRAASRTGSKPGSRVHSNAASRRASPERADERGGRGRSKLRAEGAIVRSPSSPLPMSPQAKLYRDDDIEDEEAERRAVEEDRKRFRSRQRSSSRKPQERGASRLRDESASRLTRPRGSSTTHREGPSRGGSIDPTKQQQQQQKNDRAFNKEQAARELEERRRSLARRPSAPAIPTPSDIIASRSPVGRGNDEAMPPIFEPPQRAPSRSRTTSPSMTFNSAANNPTTPRAMRHPRYNNSDSDEAVPDVPDLPRSATATQATTSPEHEASIGDLSSLPSTVYQPPRPNIRRSISVPIGEEPKIPASPFALPAALPTHPAFQHALPPSSRCRTVSPSVEKNRPAAGIRKINPGESQPGTIGYESRNNNAPVYSNVMVGIEEMLQAGQHHENSSSDPNGQPRRRSGGEYPNPPLLPELQHLAQQPIPVPPPPPPAPPRHGHGRNGSMASGSSQSGVINIAIEPVSAGAPSCGGSPSVVEMTPASATNTTNARARGHSRGRSVNETITSKISRATLRMRSASRNRNKSPPVEQMQLPPHPYETQVYGAGVASHAQYMQPPPDLPMGRSHTTSPHLERHPREIKANMTPDMVRDGFVVEGGLI